MKNRRYFLKKSGLAFTGLAFYNSISAKSYRNILGSNDRINIAFQGLGRRIPGLLNGAVSQKNIEVATYHSKKNNSEINKFLCLESKKKVKPAMEKR